VNKAVNKSLLNVNPAFNSVLIENQAVHPAFNTVHIVNKAVNKSLLNVNPAFTSGTRPFNN
jgi:hypothetical protein